MIMFIVMVIVDMIIMLLVIFLKILVIMNNNDSGLSEHHDYDPVFHIWYDYCLYYEDNDDIDDNNPRIYEYHNKRIKVL